MGIYLQKPRSYVEPPTNKREVGQVNRESFSSAATKRPKQDDNTKKKNKEAKKKGFLDLNIRTTVQFLNISK